MKRDDQINVKVSVSTRLLIANSSDSKIKLSKEMHNQVINKLTTHFINLPKLDKNNSIDTEGEHQTDFYWVLEPEILLDDVLIAYSDNSKQIQELKTRHFTSSIPWNNALILPDKSIVVEA
ncbi:36491_t:CDS:2 [Gigaspora margarita]|uniref:36491_t:CDS:1 n=1 Tax=Gigaspora margarita TaxID=4874 RepID=A0ABN7VSR0_GIGMA|nr:36491_t:CDS:2 [Gigaspora margarita]